MDFDYSPRQKEWMKRVGDFMDHYVYPAEETYDRRNGGGHQEGQSLDRRAGGGRVKEKGKGARPVEPVSARTANMAPG